MRSKKMVATFSPRTRPMVAPQPGEEGFANWEEVNEQYQAVVQAKSAIAARSPALFAAMEQGEAGNVAGATPQAAATALRGILGTTLENINTTDQALDEDDLDWRDLVPLHRQLYGG